MALKDLLQKKEEIEARMATLQDELSSLNIEIGEMISQKLVDLRGLTGKEFGAVHLNFDGFKVTETVPKKVDWDQEKLTDLYDRITAAGDNPRTYMKMKLEIGERQYDSFAQEVKAIFAEARTVKPGKPQLKFEAIQ
jgi:hypothetical protein